MFNYQKFRGLLAERGIKLKDFAEKIGLSSQTIINWKSGRSMPNLKHLGKIGKILGIDPKSLIK